MKLRGMVAGGCWGWTSKKVNLGSWIDVSAEEGDESKAAGDEGLTLRLAEEKRREEIDDLVNTALEGATASGMDMAV